MLLVARAVPAPHRLAEPRAADGQVGISHVRSLHHRPAPAGEAEIHGVIPRGVLDPERDRASVHARRAGVAAEDEDLDDPVAVEVGLGRPREDRPAIDGFQGGAVGGDDVSERLEDRPLVGFGDRRGVGVEEKRVNFSLGERGLRASDRDRETERSGFHGAPWRTVWGVIPLVGGADRA